ncbi:hypothetical protein BDP27DRAFT_1450375 [Rhodocollybia butyracea]|uniref:F-box domain-containing protein n=1 Tax=Rhodocollybia butyracea TaxID=206335 RepID=A0A9P5PNJ5_9AGAR|nr:hypothetical protein BDP27DRAFT_1450375 [Rhodocollybia butyracea]
MVSPAQFQSQYKEVLTRCRLNDVPDRSQLRTLIEHTRNELFIFFGGGYEPFATLKKILECQESLLAPIRSLPPELIHEIFSFVTAADRISYKVGSRRKKILGPVYPLTWVCHWWRRQALSRSTLWSSIDLGIVSPKANLDVVKFFHDCILRTGGTACIPMDVCIDLTEYGRESSGHSFVGPHLQLLSLLICQANKWRSLVFKGPSEDLFGRFNGIVTTLLNTRTIFFPLLEKLTLSLDGPEWTTRSPLRPLGTIFDSCPRLHTLETSSLWFGGTIDLRNLKVLRVGSYSGPSLSTLFCACPLLQSLQITMFDYESRSAPESCYTHTNLSKLHINHLPGDYFAPDAWNSVKLPKLAELIVTAHFMSSVWELDDFKEMLVRSECKLWRVNFFGSRRVPSDVVESFFKDLPVDKESSILYVDNQRFDLWQEEQNRKE